MDQGEQEQGGKAEGVSNRTTHRADYILERGVWRATCRECGWKVADAQRRQAATQFRGHIQDMRLLATSVLIDLRDRAGSAVSPATRSAPKM